MSDTTDTPGEVTGVYTDVHRGGNGTMLLKSKIFLLMLLTAWIANVADSAQAEIVHENHLFPDFCPEDLDFNWFEPIYCNEDKRPAANLGYFFEYQRLSTSVSRPKQGTVVIPTNIDQLPTTEVNVDIGGDQYSDWTNGNLFDFGYMRESNRHGAASGWLVSVMKIDNPRHRLTNPNVAFDGTTINDVAGNPIGETFVTENAFNIYGIDVNRVWRMEPTFKGAIIEPFIGLRYTRIRDHFDYLVYNREPTAPFPGSIPILDGNGQTRARTLFDQFYSSNSYTDNDLFGGQLGMRVQKRRGRWRLGTELKGFAMNNFSQSTAVVTTQTTEQVQIANYDIFGARVDIQNQGDPVIDIEPRGVVTKTANRFVWGGELRLNAGFDITKKFSIEVGGHFMAFADGIGRGQGYPTLNSPEQDVPTEGQNRGGAFTTAGATLGFSINR